MPRKKKFSAAEELVQLLQLPPDIIVDHTDHRLHEDIFYITMPVPDERTCPLCGSHDCIVRGSSLTQSIRHIPVSGRKISLSITKRRMFCNDCSSSFYETPEWVLPTLRMSTNLYKALFKDLQEIIPFTQIMKKEQVSERTIRSVFDSFEIQHPELLPKTLCIDEFHAESGVWQSERKRWYKDKYNVNVTDGDRKVVIDVLQQRNLEYLSKYFRQTYLPMQRDGVKFFCCDMSGSFISLAKKCFPKAVIIVDNFHVVQLLTRSMDQLRRREQNYFEEHKKEDVYKRLKNLALVLKTWEDNLELCFGDSAPDKKKMLEEAFQVSPDIKTMYEALQSFHDIMKSFPVSTQRDLLQEWILTYSDTSIHELKTSVSTIRSHRSYILNAWQYGKSNGPCEGLNKKIKDLKRTSFGIHSFEAFRKRILMTCGGLTLESSNIIFHIGKEKSSWS